MEFLEDENNRRIAAFGIFSRLDIFVEADHMKAITLAMREQLLQS